MLLKSKIACFARQNNLFCCVKQLGLLFTLHVLDDQEDAFRLFLPYCWHPESVGVGSYLVLLCDECWWCGGKEVTLQHGKVR